MKKLLFLMALVLPLAFVSCGGDDDDEMGKDDVNSNLPKEAQAFVGAWKNYDNRDQFIFFEDGKAWYFNNHAYGSDGIEELYNRHEVGEWTYDPTTKILATTFNNLQYQVTLTSEKNWTGINISYSSTVTFKKYSDRDIMYILMKYYKWENKSGKDFYYKGAGFSYKDKYAYVLELTGEYDLDGSIIEDIESKLHYGEEYPKHVIEDYYFFYTLDINDKESDEYDLTADFNINGYQVAHHYNSYSTSKYNAFKKMDGTKEDNCTGTIKIVNPFKPGKTVLKITGSYLEGEYNMKERD